jgi:hypothetical protein
MTAISSGYTYPYPQTPDNGEDDHADAPRHAAEHDSTIAVVKSLTA